MQANLDGCQRRREDCPAGHCSDDAENSGAYWLRTISPSRRSRTISPSRHRGGCLGPPCLSRAVCCISVRLCTTLQCSSEESGLGNGKDSVVTRTGGQTSLGAEDATGREDLHLLRRQIASVEEQIEAWRQTRLRNGDTFPRYEEAKLEDNLELLRLREGNLRNRFGDHGEDLGQVDVSSWDRSQDNARSAKNETQKKKDPNTQKNRSKGRSGRKKKQAKSRISPSRGISPLTGKRSRVRLIG